MSTVLYEIDSSSIERTGKVTSLNRGIHDVNVDATTPIIRMIMIGVQASPGAVPVLLLSTPFAPVETTIVLP